MRIPSGAEVRPASLQLQTEEWPRGLGGKGPNRSRNTRRLRRRSLPASPWLRSSSLVHGSESLTGQKLRLFGAPASGTAGRLLLGLQSATPSPMAMALQGQEGPPSKERGSHAHETEGTCSAASGPPCQGSLTGASWYGDSQPLQAKLKVRVLFFSTRTGSRRHERRHHWHSAFRSDGPCVRLSTCCFTRWSVLRLRLKTTGECRSVATAMLLEFRVLLKPRPGWRKDRRRPPSCCHAGPKRCNGLLSWRPSSGESSGHGGKAQS